MKTRLLMPLVAAALLAGCATFSNPELASIRSHHVSDVVMAKLERGKPLTPQDVIHLTRRGVAPNYIIRHIRYCGVDYLVNREDVRQMREAGVDAAVINELLVESRDFAWRYSPPPPDYNYSYYGPWFGGFGYGGFGYGGGCYHGGGHGHCH